MKKPKLSLSNLEVHSFVTHVSQPQELDGGASCACGSGVRCVWTLYGCDAITMVCSQKGGGCTGVCCDPF